MTASIADDAVMPLVVIFLDTTGLHITSYCFTPATPASGWQLFPGDERKTTLKTLVVMKTPIGTLAFLFA